eukprot:3298254-Alexandrium_andersonii.AAC.1
MSSLFGLLRWTRCWDVCCRICSWPLSGVLRAPLELAPDLGCGPARCSWADRGELSRARGLRSVEVAGQ